MFFYLFDLIWNIFTSLASIFDDDLPENKKIDSLIAMHRRK